MLETRCRLGELLRDTLKKRYGRLPSAAFVAREFNLRCEHNEPICDETARRWIRGSSMPSVARLATLAVWLDIDFNRAFCPEPMTGVRQELGLHAIAGSDPGCSPIKQLLCQRIEGLDRTRQQLLLEVVEAMEPKQIADAIQKLAA